MIHHSQLIEHGFLIADFPLSEDVLEMLKNRQWKDLDQYFLTISSNDGPLRNFLQNFLDFQTLEHIISIRCAPLDEEGIWHDDGSRFLGFSLSLNILPEHISGGELHFKKKNELTGAIISPLPIGKMVIFLSGIYGYEHKVSAVTKGERIVIAGWCS